MDKISGFEHQCIYCSHVIKNGQCHNASGQKVLQYNKLHFFVVVVVLVVLKFCPSISLSYFVLNH